MGGLFSKGRGDSGRLGDFYSTQVSTGGTKKTQQKGKTQQKRKQKTQKRKTQQKTQQKTQKRKQRQK